MGEDGIESGELSRTKASVLHVTPFNSFPSGITASASKRAKYIRWAKAREDTSSKTTSTPNSRSSPSRKTRSFHSRPTALSFT